MMMSDTAMPQRVYLTYSNRPNVVNLPPIPAPLDLTHDDTAPDNRVSMLRRESVRVKPPTVTPEQMVRILEWMRDND